MAGIGHLFYAVCLLIPIMYYARDKFNYKIAFIFLSANHFAGQDFYGTPFHSLIGIFMYAAPMALFYSYFSRFSLEKSEKSIRVKLVDTGIREISIKNSYLLGISGGILHLFVDANFHLEKNFHIWPGIELYEKDVLMWGGSAYHVVDPLLIIGYIFLVVMILVFLYSFKKGYKDTFKMLLITIGITFLLIFGFGIEAFGGEREVAILYHSILFIFIPLFLLLYVARDVEENPVETPDEIKIDRKLILNLVIILSFLVSAILLGVVVIGFFFPEILAVPIAEIAGVEPEVIVTFILIEATFALIGAIMLILGTIGLIFRNNNGRYLVITVYTGLFIFAFPFIVALFLCEKEVKEMFVSN